MARYEDEILPVTSPVAVGDSAWRYRLRWLLGRGWQRLRLPRSAPTGYWLVPATGEQILWDGASYYRGFGSLRAQFVGDGTVLVKIGDFGAAS